MKVKELIEELQVVVCIVNDLVFCSSCKHSLESFDYTHQYKCVSPKVNDIYAASSRGKQCEHYEEE